MENIATQPEVINHTGKSIVEIRALPFLGRYTNEWRKRIVSLYRVSDGQLISVGESIDGHLTVICGEPDEAHQYALTAWANGNFNYRAR